MLLDTQVLLWLRLGSTRMGHRARLEIERAWRSDEVGVSAITFWEVAMLRDKGRIRFPEDIGLWRKEQMDEGLIEIPVDGDIALRAGFLPQIHGDPADRIIVATAMSGHRLVTADRRILSWSGHLNRLDARE